MRVIAIGLGLLVGCSSSSSSPGTSYASVRDRLANPTPLSIAATPDAGAIGAEHYASGAWLAGTEPVSITDGALVASLDGSGALVASTFDLAFAPIAIPDGVFDEPAQLTGVRVALAAPATAPIAWADPDDATATLSVALTLSWSLDIGGAVTPLAAQALPPLALDVALDGTGDAVATELALHGTGALWSWADLLKLTSLYIEADGATD